MAISLVREISFSTFSSFPLWPTQLINRVIKKFAFNILSWKELNTKWANEKEFYGINSTELWTESVIANDRCE